MVTMTVFMVQIVMICIITAGFTVFTGAVTGLCLGLITWVMILTKTPLFKWFFVNVTPNWSVILGNQINRDVVPVNPDERIKMFRLVSLREVGPGLHCKLPWEMVADTVDLRSELVIGSSKGGPLECYTAGNIKLLIEWQVILTPLRGYLPNLIRKGQDATKAYFKGAFEQAIIAWVKTKTETEVFDSLSDLKSFFAEVFDGGSKVSEVEKEFGVFTNNPQIISVNRSPDYQRAAEGVQIAARTQEAIERLKLAGADANLLLLAAAATTGNPLGNAVIIPGLGQGLSKGSDVTALMAAINALKGKKP